jgi:hypothetical protein
MRLSEPFSRGLTIAFMRWFPLCVLVGFDEILDGDASLSDSTPEGSGSEGTVEGNDAPLCVSSKDNVASLLPHLAEPEPFKSPYCLFAGNARQRQA